jgi:hypothetical protein
MVYLLGLLFDSFIDWLQIGRRLWFRHSKKIDNLLLNVEKTLFHCWHVRLRLLLADNLGLNDPTLKFFFDGEQLETVESLNIVLSEVLKTGLASYADS